MQARAACRGRMPLSIFFETASITTIASSTTRPVASTSPSRVSWLIEKPNTLMKAKVPTREIGMARLGTIVARQFCRNTNRITSTSTIARPRASITPSTEDSMNWPTLYTCCTVTPGGTSAAKASICCTTASATSRALLSGVWNTATEMASWLEVSTAAVV